jgi:3-deoxy-D-manno-octulosonic-acid transferase
VFGNFYERVGIIPKTPTKNVIWFHAVSVGEVLSIQYLIEKIKRSSPGTTCYLTVGTLTGKKIAKEKNIGDIVSFLPYDFLLPMISAFRRIKPNKIIIVEAETWPNFLMLAYWKKIPTYLINARISTRPTQFGTIKKLFLREFYKFFTTIFTQSEQDKKSFESIGVATEKLTVLGNIKTYNVLAKKSAEPQNVKQQTPMLLVGSIHPGELDIYLNLYKKLKVDHPELKMTLAPRHFHWKETLIKKVTETGYKKDITLICELGKLFALYQHASIYFLGGTFVPIGGHNLLEPAAWGTPTIVGPYFFNSKVIAGSLLAQNALKIVENEKALYTTASAFLNNPDKARTVGNNARVWLEQESRSVEKKLTSFFSS